jgi:sugar phosphate permease
MTSGTLETRVAQAVIPSEVSEWRDGWRVVAGAAVGMGTGVGLYLVVRSLFVVHLTSEFGWTRGDIGVAGMVAFVTGALAMPMIGRAIDRFGYRRVVLLCVPALSSLYVMIALQPGPFGIHLCLMVWGGLVGGGTGAIGYTRPVIAAFRRRRGLALGVATAGASITAMIVPPVIAALIAAYGWRAGLYAMAALTTLVGLPIALALIGSDHEQPAPRIGNVRRDRGGNTSGDVSLRQALRGPRFWLLALALAAVNIPGAGVIAQLAPLLVDRGLSQEAAALVMSIYAAGVLSGRLVTGFSLDRLPTSAVAIMTLIPAIGMTLLLHSASFWMAAAAIAMIGIQQGSEVDLIAYIVSRSFGIGHYGAIYGAVGVAGAVSTAASFVLFGKVHDLTGSYDVALTVGSVAFCVGAVAFTASGRARAS